MEEIIEELQEAFDGLMSRIQTLTETQLKTVPASGGWTPGQVAQHLLLSYQVLSVLESPVTETTRPADQFAPALRKLFLDRTVKMVSPKEILPDARPIPKAELVGALQGITRQVINFANSNDLNLTCTAYGFPEMGHLTRLEWLTLLTVHTQRHNAQLDGMIQAEDKV